MVLRSEGSLQPENQLGHGSGPQAAPMPVAKMEVDIGTEKLSAGPCAGWSALL